MSLLPLALGLVVLTTASPVELRAAFLGGGVFDVSDLLQNLALYAPLGIALSRQRSWIVALIAFALSAGAETIQIWSFERFSSPYDVAANVLGAVMGAWAWRRCAPARAATQIVLGRFGLLVCLTIALLILAIWRMPVRSAELTGWDPTFRVLLGNETTADRPWQGTIASMRILRGALTPAELTAIDVRGAANADPLDGLTLYRSSGPIRLDGGHAVALPRSVSKHLTDDVQAEGAFTLVVQLATDDVAQDGPARIVSFSEGTLQRNFDLGQEEDRLVFRVRTAVSGLNGEHFRAETPPVLQPGQQVRVVASYDGAISRIFVDGSLYGRSNLAAAGCVMRTLCDAAVPLVWSVLGAIAAILTLATIPWPRRTWQTLVCAVAAGWVPLVLTWAPSVPTVVLTPFWMKYMSVVGASLIAVAAYSSTRARDS